MLTHSELTELLTYEPSTGDFVANANARGGWRKGQLVGTRTRSGYIRIGIRGRDYLAHRLAWFYVNGEWPKSGLDHKDGDPANNLLSNLRECDQSENGANMRRKVTNKTGLKGVWFDKELGRWRAGITINGKSRHIGVFATPSEAHSAYVAAAQTYFGEFARVA